MWSPLTCRPTWQGVAGLPYTQRRHLDTPLGLSWWRQRVATQFAAVFGWSPATIVYSCLSYPAASFPLLWPRTALLLGPRLCLQHGGSRSQAASPSSQGTWGKRKTRECTTVSFRGSTVPKQSAFSVYLSSSSYVCFPCNVFSPIQQRRVGLPRHTVFTKLQLVVNIKKLSVSLLLYFFFLNHKLHPLGAAAGKTYVWPSVVTFPSVANGNIHPFTSPAWSCGKRLSQALRKGLSCSASVRVHPERQNQ